MKQVYQHYGNNQFDNSLIKPIKNRDTWGKPYGGFWASRVDSANPWKEWCEVEGFNTERLKNHFNFILSKTKQSKKSQKALFLRSGQEVY